MARKSKLAAKESNFGKEPRVPKDAMAAHMASPEETDEEKMRKGSMDLDRLTEAHEIQSNPERMKHVMNAHAKKVTAIKSIADLKVAAQAVGERDRAKKFGKK